jgi:hypothetical protein
MTIENDRGKSVRSLFNAWAATVYPATRVVTIGTSCLRTLRQEMLCVISRIDDELKRRERGSIIDDGGVHPQARESWGATPLK